MKKYKPVKRSILFVILVVYGIDFLLSALIGVIENFVPYHLGFVALILWTVAAFLTVICIPIFNFRTVYQVSDKHINLKKGVFILSDTCMPVDSIMSITRIVTPLSMLTGLNFIIFNGLGARTVMPFLSKKDALDICNNINRLISQRNNGTSK